MRQQLGVYAVADAGEKADAMVGFFYCALWIHDSRSISFREAILNMAGLKV